MKRGGWLRRRTPLRARSGLNPTKGIRSRATGRLSMDDLQLMQMDDLARACVMVRDGASYSIDTDRLVLVWFGRCPTCGRERGLQWSHLVGRGAQSTMRWIPLNAIAQCSGCHHAFTRSEDKPADVVRFVGAEVARKLDATRLLHKARGHKIDHAAQRVANILELRASGPWALRDLEWLWEQRAIRANGGTA